jgi:hypothetical protein
MSEPIHIDFKRRRRIDSVADLQSIARQVRLYLDRETDHEYAVDVVIPDPIRDRRPFIQITLPVLDVDLEDRIERGWPRWDFDFVWGDL